MLLTRNFIRSYVICVFVIVSVALLLLCGSLVFFISTIWMSEYKSSQVNTMQENITESMLTLNSK